MMKGCLIIVFFVLGGVLILYGLANVIAGYPSDGTVPLVLGSVGIVIGIIVVIQYSRKVKGERRLQRSLARSERETRQQALRRITPANPLPSNLSLEKAKEVLRTDVWWFDERDAKDYLSYQGCRRLIEKNRLSAVLLAKMGGKGGWEIFVNGEPEDHKPNKKDAEKILIQYMTWRIPR